MIYFSKDKERVAAATENQNLLKMINRNIMM